MDVLQIRSDGGFWFRATPEVATYNLGGLGSGDYVAAYLVTLPGTPIVRRLSPALVRRLSEDGAVRRVSEEAAAEAEEEALAYYRATRLGLAPIGPKRAADLRALLYRVAGVPYGQQRAYAARRAGRPVVHLRTLTDDEAARVWSSAHAA